jgi:integrase
MAKERVRGIEPPYTPTTMGAWLYKRDRSPFWWIEYVDVTGRRRQESTKFRYDVASESRKAHDLRRELAAREKAGFDRGEIWEAWVPRFLEQRYSDPTLSRYKNSWNNVASYLYHRGVSIPRQLTRIHVREFVDWRQERHSELGLYEVCKNTALHEVKVLRILMGEAVACGFAPANPCLRLDIKKDPSPRKPRITEAEHQKILAALKHEPEWMQISYAIAWEQGCRFSETCLPLSDVDLRRGVIHFRTKGHKADRAEFPLSPNLRPLFQRLIRSGRKMTFEMPPMPGKVWWRFFKRIRMPHLCFHCTRVTFITRCYETGIPRDSVMRLVGHSSTAAHEIYPRLSASHGQLQDLMRQLA